MGQKTHPIGFRLGTTRTWSSRWFAVKGYAGLLHEDVKIRKFIKSALYHAGISRIDIDRSANRSRITIFTARPGIIIGRKGAEVEKLKNEIQSRTGKEVHLNIAEVVHPELEAQLVAENVALQLQKRVAFRRAMKKAVTSALRLGADGIRIACAGRLGGRGPGGADLHDAHPRAHDRAAMPDMRMLIPEMEDAQRELEIAVTGIRSPWGGVEFVSVDRELGEYFGVTEGLLVVKVRPDSGMPLKAGDVILGIDGRKPTSPSHALRILRSYEAGETVKLDIQRKQRKQTITWTVPEREEVHFRTPRPARPPRPERSEES